MPGFKMIYDGSDAVYDRLCEKYGEDYRLLCPPCIAELERENAALRECLMDVLNQACHHDPEGVLDSGALSAYAEAMDLLVRLGLAEWAMEGYGRRQFVRLKWSQRAAGDGEG